MCKTDWQSGRFLLEIKKRYNTMGYPWQIIAAFPSRVDAKRNSLLRGTRVVSGTRFQETMEVDLGGEAPWAGIFDGAELSYRRTKGADFIFEDPSVMFFTGPITALASRTLGSSNQAWML